MRIIILGAGQVGSSIAQILVAENNDITVVDIDRQRLEYLQTRLDLRTLAGDAVLPSILQEAGLADADMLIAVTRSDQTNLIACKLAQVLEVNVAYFYCEDDWLANAVLQLHALTSTQRHDFDTWLAGAVHARPCFA